jgi:DNA-binding transcriptional MerR regulator
LWNELTRFINSCAHSEMQDMKRNTRSLAERLGLKPKTLENWRSLGGGPAFYRVGGRVMYDDADVDAWLASRRRTSTSDRGESAS